jgi:hypothetical protein
VEGRGRRYDSNARSGGSLYKRIGLALALAWVATCAAAQGTPDAGFARKSVEIVRAPSPPLIDGRLDDPAWAQAAIIEDFRQIRPADGAPPSERTELYLLYDKDALYIAARMWDRGSPREITRNVLKQGNTLAEDDRLAIVLDPFNTGRNGYRFEVNANGVRNDMLYVNNQLQSEWTVIWEAASDVGEGSWSVEMAIPFKTLPFDPRVDSWGFNASRAIRRRGEESLWVSRNRTWNPSILGVATGFTGLDKGKGLDIVPGFSVTERRNYSAGSEAHVGDPSLDLYYRITPSLSGALTFNTDFSATEVDDRQVNLTRFNLFFPEKRDFFLNDADLFEFGRIGPAGYALGARSVTRAGQENARPFFSRRIGLSPLGTPVDLDYGGKLSGRIGPWTIGSLAVKLDEFLMPDGTVIDASEAIVARATRDVLSASSIGVIATSGNPSANLDNSLVGADFLYLNSRIAGNRTLEGEVWYQQSETEGIDGDDAAFGAGLRMPNAERWRGGVNLREVQRNFFPALGFVSRTGVRDYAADMGYTHFFQRGSRLQSVFVGADADRVDSIDGGRQTQVLALRPLELETRGRDTLKLVYTSSEEAVARPFTLYQEPGRVVAIPVGEYSFDDYGFEIDTGRQRKYAGRFVYRTGDFYDGERLNLGGEFVWKQSRHFTLRLAYDWNDIELPQGDFTTRLTRATAEVGFNSRLVWISLVQYDNVSEVFGLHSRLHWIPKAGREAFLVINRSFQDFDKNDSFQSVTSELSIKASYTFRF